MNDVFLANQLTMLANHILIGHQMPKLGQFQDPGMPLEHKHSAGLSLDEYRQIWLEIVDKRPILIENLRAINLARTEDMQWVGSNFLTFILGMIYEGKVRSVQEPLETNYKLIIEAGEITRNLFRLASKFDNSFVRVSSAM